MLDWRKELERIRDVMKLCINHRQVSQLRPRETACAVFALQSARRAFGTLQDLPYGALHTVGGLSVETAVELEEFIQELADEGVADLTVPRVMAELDSRGLVK